MAQDSNIRLQKNLSGTTGRYLVLMRQDAVQAGIRALTDIAGLKVANTADFESGAVDASTLESADAIFFDELAVAVVQAPSVGIQSLRTMATAESGILAIEPERIVYAITDSPTRRGRPASNAALPASPSPSSAAAIPVQYLLGYREAVNHLVEQTLAVNGVQMAADMAPNALDESELTWGLQLTNVAESLYSGKGVKVAVLDTGLDLNHPDFVGRNIVAKSFIDGQDVQDENGHGTHCVGTACGPKQPGRLPRYGIAHEADIFVGKVLSNEGSGSDGGILAGINWAIVNSCQIVSMSLGASTSIGDTFSPIYEAVARRALAAGTLIIAAAGNESNRPGEVNPVGHPANCPSIMAVAAVDQALQTAWFSSSGLNPQGGQVDIAGPGVNVLSSWPQPDLYKTISGTSMATPHVAGIAALLVEANPAMVGGTLGWLLLQSSQRLDLPGTDVGVGLVQAP